MQQNMKNQHELYGHNNVILVWSETPTSLTARFDLHLIHFDFVSENAPFFIRNANATGGVNRHMHLFCVSGNLFSK